MQAFQGHFGKLLEQGLVLLNTELLQCLLLFSCLNRVGAGCPHHGNGLVRRQVFVFHEVGGQKHARPSPTTSAMHAHRAALTIPYLITKLEKLLEI